MEKSKILKELSNYIDLNYNSKRTKDIYKCYGKKFIYINHPDTIDKLSNKYLTNYLVNIKNTKSLSYYNQNVSVLKILYQKSIKAKKIKGYKMR